MKSRRIKWVGHVARKWAKRNAYKLSVGKPEGNKSLGGPRPRWVDNIKMDLEEIGWDGMDWIDLHQDRDQWMTYEHGNEPSSSVTCWEILE
jgi:hypothetical protein